MTILQVALQTPLRRLFDYKLPPGCEQLCLQPGTRLKVPFRGQHKMGILINVTDQTAVPLNKLRAAEEILDRTPLLDEETLALCAWASDYYQYPLGEVLSCCLPKHFREGKPAELKKEKKATLRESLDNALKRCVRSLKQQECLKIIAAHPQGIFESVLKNLGVDRPTLSALSKKGSVFFEECDADPFQRQKMQTPLSLNAEQQFALDAIVKSAGQFSRFLLDGVTGSGKTEVYLQAIANTLEQDKQCLILIPEIGLTPQTVSRFQARFDCDIALLHSGLNDTERATAWLKAKLNIAKIIIGTRSAVFTPCPSLGLIIIDEEHDTSFKQQDNVRYSARDLALVRGMKANIPVVLGSATPSLETLYNAQIGRYEWLRLPTRAGGALAPKFVIVDCRQTQMRHALSKQLLEAIEQHLKAGNQVLLFINRRGYAPILICHSCGWIAHCKACDAHLTLHQLPRNLQCHHCGRCQKVPQNCESCGGAQLLTLGIGTEKLAELLTEQFPNFPVIRIDRDSTRNKGAMQSLLDIVHTGSPQILIGTQMLAKGHHFPNVTLVGIVDADSGFFSPDFRSVERLGQLITQVAGRAGREEKPGHVYIQTRQPENPFLQCLIKYGYHRFCDALLSDRQSALLPPFGHMALLRAETNQKESAHLWLNILRQKLQTNSLPIQILGPIPAAMEKRAGVYRAHLLLQAKSRTPLQSAVNQLMSDIDVADKPKNLRWSIDVDPIDVI